jgi:hypothetical protein
MQRQDRDDKWVMVKLEVKGLKIQFDASTIAFVVLMLVLAGVGLAQIADLFALL